jgi:hypothetical protein
MEGYYLLFDSGCNTCSELAHRIKDLSNNALVTKSLRDKDVQTLLDEVKPAWKWEPMLMRECKDGTIQILSGNAMRVYLLKILGLREAITVVKLLEAEITPVSSSRRSVLKKIAFALAAVFGGSLSNLMAPGKALAGYPNPCNCGCAPAPIGSPPSCSVCNSLCACGSSCSVLYNATVGYKCCADTRYGCGTGTMWILYTCC